MVILLELADAVRTRRVSSHELVERSLLRISRLDRQLNAVVALRDVALDEALAIDARVAAGEDPGPLAGLPVLIKDLEDVAGLRTTRGSALFADAEPATRDALTPARLRAAGAIVVGKTNLPEFATEGFSANLLFGATRNPWGLDWSPGGSSGGSGAALAAGLVPIATATDGGGSVRIPAALCGLLGIKPTNGVIARQLLRRAVRAVGTVARRDPEGLRRGGRRPRRSRRPAGRATRTADHLHDRQS